MGQNSSVRIMTRYRLDGPGIEYDQSTTSRQGEGLSVRVVMFSLRSAVKVIAESLECSQCMVYCLNRASFVRSTMAE